MERDVDHSRKHERILEIYNRLLSGEVLSPGRACRGIWGDIQIHSEGYKCPE